MNIKNNKFLLELIETIQKNRSLVSLVPTPIRIIYNEVISNDRDYTGDNFKYKKTKVNLPNPSKDNLTIYELRDILTGYGYSCELSNELKKSVYIFYDIKDKSIYDNINLDTVELKDGDCILTVYL